MRMTGTWDCANVKLSARDQYTVFGNRLHVTLFTSPFSLGHTRTVFKTTHFLKFPLWKPFLKDTIFIGVFRRIYISFVSFLCEKQNRLEPQPSFYGQSTVFTEAWKQLIYLKVSFFWIMVPIPSYLPVCLKI